MEVARCMQCGMPIGGTAHKSVPGNKMMATGGSGRVTRGYILSATHGAVCDENLRSEFRMSKTTVRVLRLLMHGLLLAGIEMVKSSDARIAGARADTQASSSFCDFAEFIGIGNSTRKRGLGAEPRRPLAMRLQEDWQVLLEIHGLSHTDLGVALNIVLCKCRDAGPLPASFKSYEQRSAFERWFQDQVIEPIFVNPKKAVRDARGEFGGGSHMQLLQKGFGRERWDRICEFDQALISAEDVQATEHMQDMLWRLRQPASLPHFTAVFEGKAQHFQQHRFLAAFLKEEKRLSSIRFIVDICAWHAILFSLYGSGSATSSSRTISREAAATLTNAEAVASLHPSAQPAAQATLERYCDGFNRSFPLVKMIYECTPNPFLTRRERS
eukprot:SAG11_NODE_137_length_15114_cov_2.297303_9_plen_384_part_00